MWDFHILSVNGNIRKGKWEICWLLTVDYFVKLITMHCQFQNQNLYDLKKTTIIVVLQNKRK